MASDIIQTATDSNFEALVKSTTPVLVDFWAEWCGPCKRIGPTVEELAVEYAGRLIVAKMNVDENPAVPMQFGIRGIPTLMVFKGGTMVDTMVGAGDKAAIKKLIDPHV